MLLVFFTFVHLILCSWEKRSKQFFQRHMCADVRGAVLSIWIIEACVLKNIQKSIFIHKPHVKILNDLLGLCTVQLQVFCVCNKLCLTCRACSVLLRSVFVQLLPDFSSAYCVCSPVGLLSLEHASGRGLFLIGHRPSVPTWIGGLGFGGGIRSSARTHGQRRLSGCVWALQTQSYCSLDWLTHWSILSKEAESCLIDAEI